MLICWYCYWGWPKEISDIYVKYDKVVMLDYGPGHTVWADENFDKDTIQSCIDEAEKYRGDLTDIQLELVIRSLKELLALPDEVFNVIPKDYDDEHPDKYPPAEGVVMVRERR